jgi:sporulation protein YabP
MELGTGLEERRSTGEVHQMALTGRERLDVDGVKNVGSFDQEEVVLETSAGVLVIKGANLHMQQLNLDIGKISLQGRINSLVYAEEDLNQRSRGLLGRLLK